MKIQMIHCPNAADLKFPANAPACADASRDTGEMKLNQL